MQCINGENMKNQYSEEARKRVFEQLDELTRVERARALEIIDETEAFLRDTDLDEYPIMRINILIGLARYYVNSRDIVAAETVLNRALDIAQSYDIPEEVFHVNSTIAIVHSMRGDHLKAIYIWEDMLAMMDKDHAMHRPIINNLVVAYGYTMQFTRAVDLCYQLLQDLDEGEDDIDTRVSALINLGNAYGPLKSHDKALKAYQDAYELAAKIQNVPYQSYVLSNMSGTLGDLNRYQEAYDAALKNYEICKDYYGNEQIADALSLLGSTCSRLERYDEAEKYLLEALTLRDSKSDRVGHLSNLIHLATMHLRQLHFNESLPYLEEAEPLAMELSVLHHQISVHKLYAEYYQGVGDYQKANEHLRLISDLQDKQYSEVSEKMISKQEAEYLRRKIELQNDNYLKKNEELESSNQLIQQQSDQLEKSNQELHASMGMLNRLISIISHDVRGPAANSAAALRMIQEGSFSAEASQELIGHIIDSLDGVTDLLTEIMIWIESRSFSKEVDRLMQNVNVMSILEPVLKLYQSHIKQKNIHLNLSCPHRDCETHTEPNTLKIVLRNIVSNAVKFTPEGGIITISGEHTSEHLVLSIRDSGMGMSKEEVETLLTEGLKSKLGTQKEIGMGLGLRYSLGYLKLLGVDFEINSEPGHGTEFVLKLRLAKSE